MNNDTSAELQALIDRMGQGDDSARHELLERAVGRLRRLTATLFYQSFPALRNEHELDSIVHDTWLRLLQALEAVQPPTVVDFFRLAAHKARQLLLDLAERHKRQGGREVLGLSDLTAQTPGVGNRSFDPARLALWTEFHEHVSTLPEDERSVFELHYYLGFSQADIARLLDLHPRKVSYLWVAATERLTARLGGTEVLY